jgi:hypothetical protein
MYIPLDKTFNEKAKNVYEIVTCLAWILELIVRIHQKMIRWCLYPKLLFLWCTFVYLQNILLMLLLLSTTDHSFWSVQWRYVIYNLIRNIMIIYQLNLLRSSFKSASCDLSCDIYHDMFLLAWSYYEITMQACK